MGKNLYTICSRLPKAIVGAHPCVIVAVLNLAQSWPFIIGYTIDDPSNDDLYGRLCCKRFEAHVEDLLAPPITVEGSIN